MINLWKLLAMGRALQAGAPLGDVAVLKLDALSAPSADLTRKLQVLRGYEPTVDVAALRALPAGTLGGEYARFLDANGIAPLVISAHVRERFRDNPYALRYTTTHDLHHVLAGFDAGLAGELGVLGFNVGQGAAPVSRLMFRFACFVYMLLSPTQARRIWHNAGVGLKLGAKADLVIAERIESWFEEPLDQVRKKLGISDPREAGVRASGSSLVVALMFPKQARLGERASGARP